MKGKNGASYDRVAEIRVTVHEVTEDARYVKYRYIDMHLGLFAIS